MAELGILPNATRCRLAQTLWIEGQGSTSHIVIKLTPDRISLAPNDLQHRNPIGYSTGLSVKLSQQEKNMDTEFRIYFSEMVLD